MLLSTLGARGRSRTRTPLQVSGLKPLASAVSPLGLCYPHCAAQSPNYRAAQSAQQESRVYPAQPTSSHPSSRMCHRECAPALLS